MPPTAWVNLDGLGQATGADAAHRVACGSVYVQCPAKASLQGRAAERQFPGAGASLGVSCRRTRGLFSG